MKIVVTGGAGFIASHIVDRYVQLGHQVAIIDNLSTGRRENVNPQAAFYEVDITDAAAVAEVMAAEKPELINHHAAQMSVRRSGQEPAFDAATNILGGINVMEAVLAVGTSKIIYASSGGTVYGELEYIPADESHPIRPASHYGVSKHTVEHYLELYNQAQGLVYTILRYANVYGPRQNPHGEAGVVAIFGNQMLHGEQSTIFGDGSDTRDYVFIDDIVDANSRVLDHGDNEIFNLGTGQQITVRETFAAISAATGFTGQPHYSESRVGDIAHNALDAAKARQVLGWEPTVDFEQGIQRTIEYLREAAE